MQNQSRKVDVEYKAAHGFAGSGWAIDRYVLKTGATWRGRIETCRIDVDWRKATKFSQPLLDFGAKLRTTWNRNEPRQATITLKNLEPYFDLDLTMVEGFCNFTMNGRVMPQNVVLSDRVGGTMRGDPRDIQISVYELPDFFGSNPDTGLIDEWSGGEAAAFGRSLEFTDKRTLETGKGKRIRLKRPVQGFLPDDPEDRPGYVYLKDLVEALGGTYRYNAKLDQINLTLPRK